MDSSLSHRAGEGGGVNAFYWYQIFALDFAVVEVQKCSAPMEAFLLLQSIIMEKHSNQINTLWWNKDSWNVIKVVCVNSNHAILIAYNLIS